MTEYKPFGELSRQEQLALLEAWLDGKTIEVKSAKFGWCGTDKPPSILSHCYRIAETTDSINWDHVQPQWKWMARDSGGWAYLYILKPHRGENYWAGGEASYAINKVFASYKQGTVAWDKSLVQRPAHKRDGE